VIGGVIGNEDSSEMRIQFWFRQQSRHHHVGQTRKC